MGRQKKYSSIKKMQVLIDKYFAECEAKKIKKVTKKGNIIHYPYPYTIEGLCMKLEISRETLNQYSKTEKFSDVIASARMCITDQRVTCALTGQMNPAFAKFLLSKNDTDHYDDKKQVEVSGNLGIEGLMNQIDGSANKLADKKD